MKSVEGEAALLLRSTQYGESDLVVCFQCQELGKITAIARGARRSRKRFGAGLGLFTVTEVSLENRRNAGMWTLRSARPIHSYGDSLAADVGAVAHGSYGLELVRELTAAEHPEPEIFDLLKGLLASLADAGPKAGRLRVFELRLLGALGLAPMLTRCVACLAECGDRGLHWAPGRGGVVCQACASVERGPSLASISSAAVDFLITAQALTQLASGDALEKRAESREARQAMLTLLYSYVGKPLKSVEFIAKLHNKR